VSGAANSIIRSDMPHSTVNIKIDRDGGVVVYTGASDIGQGSDTMVAQIVAEGLGCKLDRVRVVAADTDLTPIDIGSYSSRVTFMNGNAALKAAQDVKKKIVHAAAKKMACAEGRCGDTRRFCVGVAELLRAGQLLCLMPRTSSRKKDSPYGGPAAAGSVAQVSDASKDKCCADRYNKKRKEEGPKGSAEF